MKNTAFIFAISIVFLSLPFRLKAQQPAATAQSPRVFLMNTTRLAELKTKLAGQDAAIVQLVSRLRTEADKFLPMRPVSVMDKPTMPPSGDKHDYMSRAPYFWYDSTKPNGLPYVNRDGQRNPEIYLITDRRYVGELSNACRVLALAWWLTGEKKYAVKASELLTHWFIEDSTRMKPNLEYAQAVPGLNNGRGIGIIESISLMGIVDAAGLLEGSAAWTKNDATALRTWYAQYLDWMLTSKNGKDEHGTRNNHGTWYLVQATDFALYTGDTATARRLAAEGSQRIDKQVEKDGRMPLELERTTALHYCTYNLQAYFALATLAKQTGIDLWNYENPQGASIRTALDWLKPYALGEKKWEYQQIDKYNSNEYIALLMVAASAYHDPQYAQYAAGARKDGMNVMTELLGGE
ncbi:MAG TPA: alginate lyase family protein [Puia sp.]|nr:alginate lyase family protein [Puia sp.]